ncbi:MAG: fluoride efflux transporter CrcB [Prevotellaceae bacterium]|nr:fluoride efflux transporter CrcB [Prevotellaceae bacterium]MDO4932708.1 fluoride efflux transporter CrcB [Prevotellaceae bacterium]
MKELLYVFIGGGTGSVLRFFVSMLWRHLSLHPRFEDMVFPWPTFVVNIAGCLLIGVFYQYGERWGIAPETMLLLATGLCGGFTTFSTFSYEGVSLLHSGNYAMYFIYVLASVVVGLAAAALPVFIHGLSR